MTLELITADYTNKEHAKTIILLLDAYANDPMGGATPLPDFVKENLALKLSLVPNAFSLICYADNKPAGLVNCFETFSTFNCKPILNIHDLIVLSEFRGRGISKLILDKVERIAKEKDCCKITLEVLEGNTLAKSVYDKLGFGPYVLDPEMGKALFWQKQL